MRARTRRPDYWGWGIQIRGRENSISLKNHKWEKFDRFGVFGVTDRPDEYSSDYDYYGEQTNKAKLASAVTDTSFRDYSITIDFDSNEVKRVQRSDQAWEVSLEVGEFTGQYKLALPTGGGHDVEYDAITATTADRD